MPRGDLPAAMFDPSGHLDQLMAVRGAQYETRLDSGPEMVSEILWAWAARHRVRPLLIQPGKPT